MLNGEVPPDEDREVFDAFRVFMQALGRRLLPRCDGQPLDRVQRARSEVQDLASILSTLASRDVAAPIAAVVVNMYVPPTQQSAKGKGKSKSTVLRPSATPLAPNIVVHENKHLMPEQPSGSSSMDDNLRVPTDPETNWVKFAEKFTSTRCGPSAPRCFCGAYMQRDRSDDDYSCDFPPLQRRSAQR